jgi:hypothetical protein
MGELRSKKRCVPRLSELGMFGGKLTTDTLGPRTLQVGSGHPRRALCLRMLSSASIRRGGETLA